MVADTSSAVITEIDEKTIHGKGYRPCSNHFPLSIKRPSEINQQLTLLQIGSYVHLYYGTRIFKDKQIHFFKYVR